MQGDELTAAVAKVLRFEIGDDIDVWLEDGTAQRAARAVTPLLLERAAQVVDTVRPANDPSDWTEYACNINEGIDRAQAAIRALSPRRGTEGGKR